MIRTFRRHGDRVRADLEPIEVDLLRQLASELSGTIASGDEDDPVVARLFPPAVTGDRSADDELRRLLHDDLRSGRLDALADLTAVLDRATPHRGRLRVDLTGEEAMLLLGVLNDLRIAIGARIGIDQLDRDEVSADDPVTRSLAIMDHFAWLQEQLLAIIDPESVRHYEDHDHQD